MKILFLYANGTGWAERDCQSQNLEGDVRLWLGKSPGCHEMDRIIAYDPAAVTDMTHMILKLAEEEHAYFAQKEIREEQELYRRLKAKYEPTPTSDP